MFDFWICSIQDVFVELDSESPQGRLSLVLIPTFSRRPLLLSYCEMCCYRVVKMLLSYCVATEMCLSI